MKPETARRQLVKDLQRARSRMEMISLDVEAAECALATHDATHDPTQRLWLEFQTARRVSGSLAPWGDTNHEIYNRLMRVCVAELSRTNPELV